MNAIVQHQPDANLPARVDGLTALLARAETPQDFRMVIAGADALASFARSLGAEHRDALARTKRIRVEAERKLGSILLGMPKAEGTRSQLVGPSAIGGSTTEPPIHIPTLRDLGIDKKLSARAQQLAKLAEEDFRLVAEGRVKLEHVAKARPKSSPPPADPVAARSDIVYRIRMLLPLLSRGGHTADELDKIAELVAAGRTALLVAGRAS